MRFLPPEIPELRRIELDPVCDERGFFARTYCVAEFAAAGIEKAMIQDSIGHNIYSGTLRGMHLHAAAFPQTRLVRCISGAAFVAALDLRSSSPAFLTVDTFRLTEKNGTALFIPHGIALGYQTLVDDTTIYYQMSEFYDPAQERGVRWDDPAFAIPWPDAVRTIKKRDASYPDFDSKSSEWR